MRLKKYYILCYPCDKFTFKDNTEKTNVYHDRLFVLPLRSKNIINYYITGVIFGFRQRFPDCYTLIQKERYFRVLGIYTDNLQAQTDLAKIEQLKESCGYIPYTECITLFEKAFKE